MVGVFLLTRFAPSHFHFACCRASPFLGFMVPFASFPLWRSCNRRPHGKMGSTPFGTACLVGQVSLQAVRSCFHLSTAFLATLNSLRFVLGCLGYFEFRGGSQVFPTVGACYVLHLSSPPFHSRASFPSCKFFRGIYLPPP